MEINFIFIQTINIQTINLFCALDFNVLCIYFVYISTYTTICIIRKWITKIYKKSYLPYS